MSSPRPYFSARLQPGAEELFRRNDVVCCERRSTSGRSKDQVQPGGPGGGDGDGDGKLCHIYAQIRESSTPSNVVVCRGDERQTERLVFTSESNVVHVQLTAADDDSAAYFLIKFEGLTVGAHLSLVCVQNLLFFALLSFLFSPPLSFPFPALPRVGPGM